MINARKTWRKEDEAVLFERVNEFTQRGEDVEIAFDLVAVEIGRTARACKDHWGIMYKRKRKPTVKLVEVKAHEYSKLFSDFSSAYTELEKTISDLISENEQLKQRVKHLESVEKKFVEVSSYFKSAI